MRLFDLRVERRVVEGEFRPGASGSEWIDQEILRRIRARSLARTGAVDMLRTRDLTIESLGRWFAEHATGTVDRRHLRRDGLAEVARQAAGLIAPSTEETLRAAV